RNGKPEATARSESRAATRATRSHLRRRLKDKETADVYTDRKKISAVAAAIWSGRRGRLRAGRRHEQQAVLVQQPERRLHDGGVRSGLRARRRPTEPDCVDPRTPRLWR